MHAIGVDVVKAPVGSTNPYWYEFVIESDETIVSVISEHLKPDWYAASFTETDLTILFAEQAICVIRDGQLTGDASKATAAAAARGIQKQFLDWQERHTIYLGKLAEARSK
jgi:hypothetical protein